MTDADQALIARMSSDLAAITAYVARASADLQQLELSVGERLPQPMFLPQSQFQPQPQFQPPPQPPRSEGWIGKALAVAGVLVTLVGVALLLVLAAQAGLLRPEFRVLAGAALAGGLVAAAWRLRRRPGGRVGSIALAATGVAAAYIDVIAVTTIYRWVSPPAGLVIAAIVAVSGLLLARRWDSEHFGLLVLVPMLGLGPVVADGVTPLLVGFMLALSAAAVPIQVGRDWLGLHAARMAVATLPLGVALVSTSFDSARSPLLAIACAGRCACVGEHVAPAADGDQRDGDGAAECGGDHAGVGGCPRRRPGDGFPDGGRAGNGPARDRVRRIPAAFGRCRGADRLVRTGRCGEPHRGDGRLRRSGGGTRPAGNGGRRGGGGRRDTAARWCALGFGVVGGLCHLAYAPPSTLVTATVPASSIAVSTLVGGVLMTACAVVVGFSWRTDWSWVIAAAVALYGITTFSVTAGVLIGGAADGFFAGHVVATTCWIALAAAVFRHAARAPRAQRSLPIGGGMAIVAAAVVKLFLFDLGTLDGIFRVVVFIVVGLALLGMGAGYARLLAQQDDREVQP